MKRVREEGSPLGASEFAGGLNSDDPRLILNLLQRFVSTVRRERRLALDLVPSEEDDRDHEDLDEAGNDDDEAESPSESKRLRKDESWKEDIAEYKVPFVGTSYAKGETGSVVVGQWPTGLLQAYLRKSPLATELVGDTLIPGVGYIHKSLMKSKQGRMSQAIYKAYLLALAELVSAAIPIEKLRGDPFSKIQTVDDASPLPFLPDIVKQRVPGLFVLLKEETASGKGKAGVVGGCGVLAPCVLRILARLAACSTQNARHIARSLDSSLPDGVLRFVLRPQSKRPGKEDDDKTIPREEARVAALELATALLVEKDAVVSSCISTAGVKDRKVHPGILYLALKDGLSETFLDTLALKSAKNYRLLEEVARLLHSLRLNLMDRPELLHKRTLADLFSRDAVKNLCDVAAHAPPLTDTITFLETLQATDSYHSLTRLEEAGVEARRALFPLLAVTRLSPFIRSLRVDTGSSRTGEQQLVRAMILLLDSHRGLEIQRFLLYCVEVTPCLFPALFRALSFPDARKCSSFLSRLNFVSRLVREGPPPSLCLVNVEKLIDDHRFDQILLVVLPVGLKRNTLSKAVQSSNPLVVNETLQLLVLAIGRFRALKSHLGKHAKTDALGLLDDAFTHWLPDLQIVLATLSRFANLSRNKFNVFVVANICALVRAFVSAVPGSVREVKFDWIKLLPDSADVFCKSTHSIQMLLLRTLRDVLVVREETPSVLANSCRAVLEIAMMTPSSSVLTLARDITLFMFRRVVSSRVEDSESQMCLEYEASCWFDGMTKETLPEFCKVIQEASQLSFRSVVAFAEAWIASSLPGTMPALSVSAILVHAMRRLSKVSEAFLLLTCQVASKCLLYDLNPLPLATIVVHSRVRLTGTSDDGPSLKHAFYDDLWNYAHSLVEFSRYTPAERNGFVNSMLSSCLSAGSYPRVFVESPSDSMIPQRLPQADKGARFVREDNEAIARHLSHLVLVSENDNERESHLKVMKRILPSAIMYCADLRSLTFRERLGSHEGSADLMPSGAGKLDVLFLSCKAASFAATNEESETGPTRSPLQGIQDLIPSMSSMASRLPFLFLVGPFLPAPSVKACLVELLDLCSSDVVGRTVEGKALAVTTVSYLKELVSSLERNPVKDSDTSLHDALFGAWLFLAKESSHGLLITELVTHLERVLCHLLSDDGLTLLSTAVYTSCIRQSSPSEVVELCLQSKLKMSGVLGRGQPVDCMLAAIIDCDLVLFAPVLLARLMGADEQNDICRQALDKGLLDKAILSIVKEKTIVEEHRLAISSVFEKTVSRANKALSGNADSGDFGTIVSILLPCCEELKSQPSVVRSLAAGLTNLVSDVSAFKFIDLQPSTQEQVFTLALRVCRLKGDGIIQEYETLASAVVVCLCEFVTSSLPHEMHRTGTDRPLHAGNNQVNLLVAIDLLRHILEVVKGYDQEVFAKKGPSFVRGLVKVCLKHGVGQVGEETQFLQASCLGLVRQLMIMISGQVPLLSRAFKRPMGTQVFDMLTTHSQFRLAIAPGNADARDSRLETLRLLSSCLSLAESIEFDTDIWQALLAGYDAGMTESDIIMRQVLFLYWENVPEGSNVGTMEQVRWGDGANHGQENQTWDGLVGMIDLSRIQATLRRYPIEDTLRPTLIDNFEARCPLVETRSRNDAQIMTDPDNAVSLHATRTTTSESDRRYSPGFLLPLLLAALESVVDSWGGTEEIRAEDPTGHGWTREGGRSGSDDRQIGIHTTQRLCDKGCLALALASLCSNCSSVRRVAASILGLLTIVIDSKAARQTPSWRERPQLAMILNSVQRALTIQHVEDVSRQPEEQTSPVPMLPGVSAVFLARACLVLANPGSSMFAAMNRSFLRLQDDHGAFQDLNRLPAFISLFCSSAEDPWQATKERMWAMELVKDGFVDEDCYRFLVACHAPELLLTSIENFRARSVNDRDGECALLLATLSRVLTNGGERAASHIVGRLGLLSWLRSVLVGRPAFIVLPTLMLRLSFMGLATSVAKTALSVIPEDELLLATAGLAQPALDLCLNSLEDVKTDPESLGDHDAYAPLFSATSEFLSALSSARIDQQGRNEQPDGFSLASAYKFLSAHSCPRQRELSVLSLCQLPFRFKECDSVPAAAFCKLAFDVAVQSDHSHTTLAVLQRILLVTTKFGDSLDSDNSLVRTLLARRRACLQHPEVRQTWFKCVSELVRSSCITEGKQAVQLADDLVSSKTAGAITW